MAFLLLLAYMYDFNLIYLKWRHKSHIEIYKLDSWPNCSYDLSGRKMLLFDFFGEIAVPYKIIFSINIVFPHINLVSATFDLTRFLTRYACHSKSSNSTGLKTSLISWTMLSIYVFALYAQHHSSAWLGGQLNPQQQYTHPLFNTGVVFNNINLKTIKLWRSCVQA